MATLLQLAALLAVSAAGAALALLGLAHLSTGSTDDRQDIPEEDAMLLFDGEVLVDANEPGRRLLGDPVWAESDWSRLLACLGPNHADFAGLVEDLPDKGAVVSTGAGDGQVTATWRNGLVRVVVRNGRPTDSVALERAHLAALEAELETLRTVTQAAPCLVWRQRSDGEITWANRAYLDICGLCDPDETTPWPPRPLFDATRIPDQGEDGRRLTVLVPGEAEPRWFECTSVALGQDTLCMAVAADGAVRAETNLREFTQTLTKTFAHLQTGLAIFDRQRRLALFNPALTDLTGLPPDFLAGQPTLFAVLDRLREKRMVPEHRDYRTWRQRLGELEAEAESGAYQETWSLATGQTYRVSGHPHPNGGLAFLFEDVTAEISLARRFRLELETGQAVIDSIDEALAVFTSNGTLAMTNAAYARLWGEDPDERVEPTTIVAATRAWSELCAPTPVWGDARDFVSAIGERAEWTADVRMRDGRALDCRFVPIVGGSTLIGFRLAEIAARAAPAEAQPLVLPPRDRARV